jgi:hypothetical protein
MDAPGEFDAVADACIANHEEIVQHGSSEMQTASRILLYALAEEIRRRSRGDETADGQSKLAALRRELSERGFRLAARSVPLHSLNWLGTRGQF